MSGEYKVVFTALDQADDLGKAEHDWRGRGWRDPHSAENDIGSLLMLSVDKLLELFESENYPDKKVTLAPSPTQYRIGVPRFGVIKECQPKMPK